MEKFLQVQDNIVSLNLMMEDTMKGPESFRPTNYWAFYEKTFLPELKEKGLQDFRRRKKTVLNSFGATDLISEYDGFNIYTNKLLYNDFTKKIPLFTTAFLSYINKVNSALLPVPKKKVLANQKEAYHFAREYGIKMGAIPIEKFSASEYGNPEDLFEIENRTYTRSSLYYYMNYAYVQQFIDFNKIQTLFELGSGMGKQVEVLKKLFPHLTIFTCDIPPQLYVCQQYLSHVFPGEVEQYENNRNFNNIENAKAGKIYILNTWQFPMLNKSSVDLFWNAASFQEMEPEIVAHYLSYVKTSAKNVFLQELMEGKELAAKSGNHGVIKKTTLEHYQNALTNFNMLDLGRTMLPSSKLSPYSNSFWVRK